MLTWYGTLRRDAAHLAAAEFHYVVLDEAQAIKNAGTVSAKTTRILQSRHRLALSGTPVENHLGELWSLFEFLNPGLLSTAAAFGRAGLSRPGGSGGNSGNARSRAAAVHPAADKGAGCVRIFRPRTEQTLICELDRPQRQLYDELLAHYRRRLLGGEGVVRAHEIAGAGSVAPAAPGRMPSRR